MKMKRLTKKSKEKMAYEILELLKEYELNTDTRIYFSNKCLTGEGETIENIKGSEYFNYANDDTLSMSFEGGFYSVINYYNPQLADEVEPIFSEILNSYGLYYELGDAWNLAIYYNQSELNQGVIELEEGTDPKNPIYINSNVCPTELESIRSEWEKRENEYGDVGSCVLGAGFRFKFDGLYYKMPPQGHYQGSCSWEASADIIREMLKNAGCKEISYDWGNMD